MGLYHGKGWAWDTCTQAETGAGAPCTLQLWGMAMG